MTYTTETFTISDGYNRTPDVLDMLQRLGINATVTGGYGTWDGEVEYATVITVELDRRTRRRLIDGLADLAGIRWVHHTIARDVVTDHIDLDETRFRLDRVSADLGA